jgi:hypothetical protein
MTNEEKEVYLTLAGWGFKYWGPADEYTWFKEIPNQHRLYHTLDQAFEKQMNHKI